MIDLNDLIGKQFENHGRGPDAFDCWGLAMEVMRRGGRQLPDYLVDADATGDINAKYSSLLFSCMSGVGCWHELKGPEPMAIVAIKNRPGLVTHIGVCLDNGRVIHISRKSNVMIEQLSSIRLKNRIAGFYRYIG